MYRSYSILLKMEVFEPFYVQVRLLFKILILIQNGI